MCYVVGLCFLWHRGMWFLCLLLPKNNSMPNAVIMLHFWSLHLWHTQALNHLYLFDMHANIPQIAKPIIKQYTGLFITSEIHSFYFNTETEVIANQKLSWVCYFKAIILIWYNLLQQNRDFLNSWSCINLHKYYIFTGSFS